MATDDPLGLKGLDLKGGGEPSPDGDDESEMADEIESEARLMNARKILKVLGLPASKAAELRDALTAFFGTADDMDD